MQLIELDDIMRAVSGAQMLFYTTPGSANNFFTGRRSPCSLSCYTEDNEEGRNNLKTQNKYNRKTQEATKLPYLYLTKRR